MTRITKNSNSKFVRVYNSAVNLAIRQFENKNQNNGESSFIRCVAHLVCSRIRVGTHLLYTNVINIPSHTYTYLYSYNLILLSVKIIFDDAVNVCACRHALPKFCVSVFLFSPLCMYVLFYT